jgi:hypothetical protein
MIPLELAVLLARSSAPGPGPVEGPAGMLMRINASRLAPRFMGTVNDSGSLSPLGKR